MEFFEEIVLDLILIKKRRVVNKKKETSFRKPPLCERKSEPDLAAGLDGLALVELEDPARVGGEVVHFKLVVGVRDDLKSVVAHGRVLEFAHDSLRVLDGRDISVSNVVVFCNSKFMLCLSQHELVRASRTSRRFH